MVAKQRIADTIVEHAVRILSEHRPMTVRQVYYQLVAGMIIENTRTRYQSVSTALRDARLDGRVPWEWIEDRTRQPRHVSSWDSIEDFAMSAIASYRRDIWDTQPEQVEVWLEKDALSGIFADVLRPYGVTLNVGRGYDGWSSVHQASERWGVGDTATVLYFGDFDPSGEDMVRSLRSRWSKLGCHPNLIKCAITRDDIEEHNLPSDFAKRSDTRSTKFIQEHGDVSVELDALPIQVLQDRIRSEVEQHLDMDALRLVQKQEEVDIAEIQSRFSV